MLIVDAQTGQTLFESHADKYFVPASNMKLFTTALALAKLGPDYRFHTTLETNGALSAAGVLTGDLFLVGRGDPNLSGRVREDGTLAFENEDHSYDGDPATRVSFPFADAA